MSQAEDLLNMLSDDTEIEAHIIIGKDRSITVPDSLKRIAVQFDHNVETVTFDCPRYWDSHDLSKMNIYINYELSDGYKDSFPCTNVTVNTFDETVIHFDWTISKNVTPITGNIRFSVCAKVDDEFGNEKTHWNSDINEDMYITEGIEGYNYIFEHYPDIVDGLSTMKKYLDLRKSAQYLFFNSTTITEIPADILKYSDTCNVINMKHMFAGCSSITAIPLFNTTNVEDMSAMFSGCDSLVTIPKFDTSNVKDMSVMFYGCGSLITIPKLDTSNVTNMNQMFYNCTSLSSIEFTDMSKVTNTRYMFYGCKNLSDVCTLDISSATEISYMFYNCKELHDVIISNASKVKYMSNTFLNCTKLTKVVISKLNTIENMSSIFYNLYNLKDVEIYDALSVTSTRNMFSGCTSLNTVKFYGGNSISDMSDMFDSCTHLQSVDFGDTDTSNVTNMNSMFYQCTALTKAPELNTSSVTNMGAMFGYCYELTTIPEYDTSSVTNMSGMFAGCNKLAKLPSKFNTDNVTNISGMFVNCYKLRSIPELNLINASTTHGFVEGCTNITECNVKNINYSLQVCSGNSYGHLLTTETLVNMISELIKNTSGTTKYLTIGTSNIEKLKKVNVSSMYITEDMRNKDPYVDQKLPVFISGTSSNSGSVLSYVKYKGWELR